jgi:hypothetical protein
MQHGFSLGHVAVSTRPPKLSIAAWLTSHGLDVTRSDLDQQALINDHACHRSPRSSKLSQTGGKNRPRQTVGDAAPSA